MYLKGWGVPQDTDKAMYWFKKAANQGNAKAETALGLIYLTTAYTNNLLGYQFHNANDIAIATKDYPKALYWFKKAAEQGYANAENYLGYMYEQGLGVPQDYNKALYWYKKAAKKGSKQAKRELEHLE